jgi:rfaE bifunctional protein nucleotidyltransferase chain/domain
MPTTKVIWTNGCFDILHRGHIELFKFAKSKGDYLVVGVDTDERVSRSKGPSRPFNKLQDRVAMLEAIKFIDKVVCFDVESELRAQILLNNAKTIVVGKEYKDKGVIGAEMVDEVVFFDRLGDYSTTSILESK